MKKYSLFITDIDGVLTDGKINYISSLNGDGLWELKSFNAKDGAVIKELLKKGIEVMFLSGRKSKVVEYRGKELGVKEIHLGVENKLDYLSKWLQEKGIAWENVVYVGDDLPDLGCMERVGLSCCPCDANEKVKSVSVFITDSCGGEGVIKEVVERYAYEFGLE
jgi:3-deoxy-D-manno-octulosonate 8-phosphate phosphatase (KDO 8-P phosphatase)